MQLPEDAAKHKADAPIESESGRRARRLSLFLLLAACIAARFWRLAGKPFWFDECYSVELARIGWLNFLHLLWWREANMSLYYVLLRIWLHLGQSEFFIRSFSVFVAAATVPAIYWLARQLYNRRVALIAAALFTFNAYSVRYSQEARSYALFLLLAALSSGFWIALLREPSRRNGIGYAAASILGIYAHFYALLLVATHWLTWRALAAPDGGAASRPKIMSDLRRAWIAISVAALPVLIFVAKTGAGPIRWIQRPGLSEVLQFYENLAGSNHWPLPAVYAVAGIAALAPLGKRLWVRDQSWETWRSQFLLLWLFFPVAFTVLLSFARPVFLGRYMIFCLPPLLILAAAGLAKIRHQWLLASALAGTLLLSVQGILFVYGHDFDKERDGSGAASNLILDHTRPGDAIVFHIAATRVAYEFFRSVRVHQYPASASFTDQLGPEILFPRHSTGLDYRDFTGKPTADLLRAIASSHPRLWVMLMNNGSEEHPDETTVMLTQVLQGSFVEVRCWRFPRVEVRLYSKP